MYRDQINRDEELPEHLKQQWESWIRDLPALVNMLSPRCFIPPGFGEIKGYELHHLLTQAGYRECSYLRVVSHLDEVHCYLVMGKSRVSSTNVMTIPRFELSPAVVAVCVSDLLRNEPTGVLLDRFHSCS